MAWVISTLTSSRSKVAGVGEGVGGIRRENIFSRKPGFRVGAAIAVGKPLVAVSDLVGVGVGSGVGVREAVGEGVFVGAVVEGVGDSVGVGVQFCSCWQVLVGCGGTGVDVQLWVCSQGIGGEDVGVQFCCCSQEKVGTGVGVQFGQGSGC